MEITNSTSSFRIERRFLSVVIRTQGTRIELLGDALLCLAGQTDDDFDVVIVQHSTQDDAGVRALVESQPPFFRERINILSVEGGNRGVPLNVGVAAATGDYVAFFDDDDLVSAGWVEAFHRGSILAPGTVQRSQVATLPAMARNWPGVTQQGFGSIEIPKAEYAHTFSQVDHLLVSHTPFMALAFPLALFHQRGLLFDESLQVCEDWDILLQASSYVAVNDVDELTAFYRRWSGLRSSYTDHEVSEWSASEARVIDRIASLPFSMRGGSVERIRELLNKEVELHAARQKLEEHGLILGSMSWKITAPLRWTKEVLKRLRHPRDRN